MGLTVKVVARIKETAEALGTDAEAWNKLVENLPRQTCELYGTNRVPSINNYLIKKIKVTSFYNTIRSATDALSVH